jgi:hypothetical protein
MIGPKPGIFKLILFYLKDLQICGFPLMRGDVKCVNSLSYKDLALPVGAG